MVRQEILALEYGSPAQPGFFVTAGTTTVSNALPGIASFRDFAMELDVSTFSGAGAITPTLETSPDGATFTTWAVLTPVTGTGLYREAVAGMPMGDWVRLKLVSGGGAPGPLVIGQFSRLAGYQAT